MNIAKNMEAIFLAAIVIANATTLATAAVPEVSAPRAVVATAPAAPVAAVIAKADSAPMQVVTVTAKRLTAAEKAAL